MCVLLRNAMVQLQLRLRTSVALAVCLLYTQSPLLPSAESPPVFVLVGFPQKIVRWRSACLDSSQAAELLCSCGMLWCPPSSWHHVFCPGTSCSIWYATATGDYTLHNAGWNTLLFAWFLRGEPRRIDKRSCQWEREGKMETFPAWSCSAKAFQQVEIMFLRDGFSIQDP